MHILGNVLCISFCLFCINHLQWEKWHLLDNYIKRVGIISIGLSLHLFHVYFVNYHEKLSTRTKINLIVIVHNAIQWYVCFIGKIFQTQVLQIGFCENTLRLFVLILNIRDNMKNVNKLTKLSLSLFCIAVQFISCGFWDSSNCSPQQHLKSLLQKPVLQLFIKLPFNSNSPGYFIDLCWRLFARNPQQEFLNILIKGLEMIDEKLIKIILDHFIITHSASKHVCSLHSPICLPQPFWAECCADSHAWCQSKQEHCAFWIDGSCRAVKVEYLCTYHKILFQQLIKNAIWCKTSTPCYS